MKDVEKIYKGMKCCSEFLCGECSYQKYDSKEYSLRCMYILMLDVNKMFDKLIDEIESTDWYHISKDGKLVHGANSKEEGTEPLYKAEDILKILDKYRSEDD